MPEGRPAIPAALKRAVMEESGYRCAIPTCKSTAALELAHISPWAKVKEHAFDNLIVLCANDHFRFDRGEIPRKSVEVFKANLGLLKSRYSDAERRMLEVFALDQTVPLDNPAAGFPIPGGTGYTMMYLKLDGLVNIVPNNAISIGGLPPYEVVTLTPKGADVVRRMRSAMLIDADAE